MEALDENRLLDVADLEEQSFAGMVVDAVIVGQNEDLAGRIDGQALDLVLDVTVQCQQVGNEIAHFLL